MNADKSPLALESFKQAIESGDIEHLLWWADTANDIMRGHRRANRQLRDALVNLRGWTVANCKAPMHDILAATDAALDVPNKQICELGQIEEK